MIAQQRVSQRRRVWSSFTVSQESVALEVWPLSDTEKSLHTVDPSMLTAAIPLWDALATWPTFRSSAMA